MPLILKQSCANCGHFNLSDGFCAHPPTFKLPMFSYIRYPSRIVCDLHEPKPAEDVDAAPI